jgi:hypothetical protein
VREAKSLAALTSRGGWGCCWTERQLCCVRE